MENETFNFEKSFHRLEEILEKLNSGETSIDDSLKYYEEANQLIIGCSRKLNEAEKKIEVLIKNRNGELVLNEGKPTKEDFKAGK